MNFLTSPCPVPISYLLSTFALLQHGGRTGHNRLVMKKLASREAMLLATSVAKIVFISPVPIVYFCNINAKDSGGL